MGIGFVVLSCNEKQEQFKNRATLTSKYHFPGLQEWHWLGKWKRNVSTTKLDF